MTLFFVAFASVAAAQAAEPRAEAGDPCPSTVGGLEAAVAETFAAWEQTNRAAYLDARDQVFIQLDCLSELLSPAAAADVHAVMALDAFIARRPDEVAGALRAYAVARPDAPLSGRLKLPPPLATAAVEAAKQGLGPQEDLPLGAAFWVDGVAVTTWPVTRTAVLQSPSVDDSDRLWTDRIPLGGPVPTPPPWVFQPAALERPRSRSRAAVWWTSAGVSALTSGGLWWGALRARSTFNGYTDTVATSGPLPASQRAEVEATAQRANRLGVAAQVFSGATVGLSSVALSVTF